VAEPVATAVGGAASAADAAGEEAAADSARGRWGASSGLPGATLWPFP
jgi:hypothetical protein